MPHYYTLGNIPHKRHTQYRKPNGELYHEELVSTEGFSSIYSNVYHAHPPTLVKGILPGKSVAPKIVTKENIQHRAFLGFKTEPQDDFLDSRKTVFANEDCNVTLAAPRKSMEGYFYKNSTADEMIFVHIGTGTLKTAFGQIKFGFGDYLVIPRGVIYQLEFDTEDNRLFIVESFGPISFPNRYKNDVGQLLEHSPFCERDIRKPADLKTYDELGEFEVRIRKGDMLHPFIYGSHPFDYIGWDGYYFPYAFNINDFEPITGRVHQPPPVHQTFAAKGFVICSFVPRLFDYHPQAIPAPYNHSNVDSDELLYYVEGEFMSRKHVEIGMISLHPLGIPHGPHPGTVEKSIGQKDTAELAVMVDTFKPLYLTEHAFAIEEPDYWASWQT